MAVLKQAPAAEWGARTGLVQEVYYQGEPYRDVFVDSVLRGGTPLPCLGPMKIDNDRVSAKVVAPVPIKAAALYYTCDTGEWQKRRWETVPADVGHGTVSAHLPAQRPLVWFLSATDERGLRVSTEHETR